MIRAFLPPPKGSSPYGDTPPLSAEEQLVEAVWLAQGIIITSEEYAEIARAEALHDQEAQRIQWQSTQIEADDLWLYRGEARQSKVLSVVSSVVVGFASGGVLGAVIALAATVLQKRPGQDGRKQEDQQFNQVYGIRDGGQLAIAGSSVPMAYGSRSQSIDAEGNECGGVRVGGLLAGTRIDTRSGVNYLYQLWILSTGAGTDGIGQLGSVDTSRILFDNQERDNFSPEEIQTQVRLGSQNQSATSWFPEYSQNVTPQNYNQFGIDFRAAVDGNSASTDVSIANGINVGFSGNNLNISKLSDTDAWDAYVWSEETVRWGGEFLFSTAQDGRTKAAGLAGIQKAVTEADLDYGFYFNNDRVFVVEAGERKASRTYAGTADFKIEVSDGGTLSYFVDGTRLYDSSIVPPAKLFANLLFFGSGTSFTNVTTSTQRGGIKGADVSRSSFETDQQGFERLSSADQYTLCNGQPGRDASSFKILEKDVGPRRCLTDSAVRLDDGAAIYAYWTAVYATTKHVNSVELNMAFSVWAKTEDGFYTTYGVLFDIWVRKSDEDEDNDRRLGRFYVRSRIPVRLNRGIRFENFPLGRYIFTIRPQCRPLSDEPVFELTDNGLSSEDDTTATIDGDRIRMQGEFVKLTEAGVFPGDLPGEMDNDGRSDISTNQGAPGLLVSVNELVLPSKIGIPANGQPHRYPGLAGLQVRYEGSDRIQSNPGIAALVDEGKTVRNLMAAGEAAAISTDTTLNDPTASFVEMRRGWILRNLSKRTEAPITQVDGSTLTTDASLNWEEGDRYLVFYVGSSPYFPDTAAALAWDDRGGVAKDVDADNGIDYPSFVAARKWCKDNRYYWNGIIEPPQASVVEWIEREARGSLLQAGSIDDRWALFPEDSVTDADAVQIFNASNAKDFTFAWTSTDQTQSEINRVVIRYADGRELFEEDGARFREKLVEIESRAVYDGTEAPIETVIDMTAVTSPLQAADAGVAIYNSAQAQDYNRSFLTSQQAAYAIGGTIIQIQDPFTRTGEEYSGAVRQIEALSGGTQKVLLNTQPILYEGLTDVASTNGAAFTGTNHSVTSVTSGDLLINQTTKVSATITSTDDTHFYAPLPCDGGDLVTVVNATALGSLTASVTYRADGSSQRGLSYAYEVRGDAVWLVLSGLRRSLAVGDPVNIGSGDLYRATSVKAQGKASYSVECVAHPGDLRGRSGLVVRYDSKVIFG